MAAGNRNWQKSLENPEDHEAVINAAARLVGKEDAADDAKAAAAAAPGAGGAAGAGEESTVEDERKGKESTR
jgi:hypothetical protein